MLEVFSEPTPQKENATDAAAERETVISWSDADQVVTITTSQRPMLTQLSRNDNAKLIWTDGTSSRYELPLGLITVRKGKKSGSGAKKAKRVLNAARCGHIKDDGTVCQMVAMKSTGKCRWHS